jgi:methionyl-tRNA synthetase
MYVWFDALTSYISTLGWPDNTEQFERFWKNGSPIQFCGKDNNRQQSAMWQAMLMSADLPSTAHVVIDGFITSGGQKMSKSIGNVISPFDVIEYFKPYTQFPEDVLRFVLLHDIPSFEDGDLTMESIRASYVAHLQNGIGNLTSRIMKMAITHFDEPIDMTDLNKTFEVTNFDLKKSIEGAWSEVTSLDAYIQSTEPFKLVKKDLSAGKEVIKNCVAFLFEISQLLRPFLPHTSTEILRLIREHKMPETPLFNRLPE